MTRRLGTTFEQWTILVGRELASLIDPYRDGRFYWQRDILLDGYRADGLPLPNLSFQVEPRLGPRCYRVMLGPDMVGYGEVRDGYLLASGPQHALDRMAGQAVNSSLLASVGYGLHLVGHTPLGRSLWSGIPLVRERWIAIGDRPLVEAMGCRTRDPVPDLGAQLFSAYHLSRAARMDERMVMAVLRERARRTPELVESVLAHYRSAYLISALRHLLDRGVGLGKLDLYLAHLGSLLGHPLRHDSYLIRERIESDAHPVVVTSLLERWAQSRRSLQVYRLPPEIEQAAQMALQTSPGHLHTEFGDRLVLSVARWQQHLEPSQAPRALAVIDSLRRPLAARLYSFLDDPVTLLADRDLESLSSYFRAGIVPMVAEAELESRDSAEPALFLESISWRIGSDWEERRADFRAASLKLRQCMAQKLGLAIPDVVAELDPLLRADELALCLKHQERASFGGQSGEDLSELLIDFAHQHLEDMLSLQSVDDLLGQVASEHPAIAGAIRECYSLTELRDVYLGLLKAGLKVNRQIDILEYLSTTKNNVYALVEELRSRLLSEHSPASTTQPKAVWRIQLGRGLESLMNTSLRPQLESLFSLYSQDQLPLPEIVFAVEPRLSRFSYRVELDHRMVGGGEIRPDRLLATGPEHLLATLPGEATVVSLLSGLGWSAVNLRERQDLFSHYQGAHWLEAIDRSRYEAVGCRVRDPHFDFGAQLVATYAVFFADVLSTEVVDALRGQNSSLEKGHGWHTSRSLRKLLTFVYQRRIPVGNLGDLITLAEGLAPGGTQPSSVHLTAERFLLDQPEPPRPEGLQSVYFAKAVIGRLLAGLTRRGDLADRDCWRSFQSKLRELQADHAAQASGLLLHLPKVLHAPVRNLVANALSGWVWLAEAPKRRPRGGLAVARLSPSPRSTSKPRTAPLELELEPLSIELGRLWRSQQLAVRALIKKIEQDRLRPRLGLHVSSVVVRVNALLPIDSVALSIDGQRVREWKAPPLSVEFLRLVPLPLVREEPGVVLPFAELYALTRDPGGQSDGVGWQTLMFWVLEDLLLGNISSLLSHARMAELLRQAEFYWPRTIRKLTERWSLWQVREVYLQLLSSGVGVAQHEQILHAVAEHQGHFHTVLETVRMAIAPALVRQYMRGNHLHVITLNQRSCAKLRRELPEDPPALSFDGSARLQEILLGHCGDMLGHFVLLVPPDLRRPVECALEQWNVPVLSTAEVQPSIALAHELTLDL